MGPGVAIKAVLQGSFSLMVFGWAQIVMDIQPLIVLLSGQGQLHGFSHTFVGATLIAIFSALSGKYLSEIGLFILDINREWQIKISWWVAFLSAFIGTFSHVLLDGIMHADVVPFSPFASNNLFLGLISVSALHKLCIYSGLVGAILYFAVNWVRKFNKKNQQDSAGGSPLL
jgi:membrane-bound metal-dependent hydrolase YbcI (DUF457 family)